MSWWIHLVDENKKTLEVPKHSDGGTYVLGGTTEAELNITYNYSKHYHKELDVEFGIKWLDKKKASACIERLEKSIEALGTERCKNYWEPIKGNAGYALSILLEWAQQHPIAEFRVD